MGGSDENWRIQHNVLHHTYTNVTGMDYQILIEADFLVNFEEENTDTEAIKKVYKNIFKTKTGKEFCRNIFDISP